MAGMAHLDSASQGNVDLEPLLSGYHCIFPRNFDEMMDHHGRVREHWRPFLGMLAALGPEEVNRRFAAADRHLRDSGVFYRVYEDPAGAVRPWPLSHVPLLIDAIQRPAPSRSYRVRGSGCAARCLASRSSSRGGRARA